MLIMSSFKSGKSIEFSPGFSLSLIQQGDFNDIVTMLEDPKVTEYLFFAPAPEEIYHAYFDSIIKNTAQAIEKSAWPDNITGIIRDKDGTFMGMCGLHVVMFLDGNYEVGFQLSEHAWGKGLATSSCRFMLSIAFELLGAHKVVADCYRANVGSYKALSKSGLVEEGCQNHYYKINQGYDDRLLYGITKAQFDAAVVTRVVS